ncbi:MAG: hypothetical protein ACP5OV_02960 [Acidimicrobiales bacterium]
MATGLIPVFEVVDIISIAQAILVNLGAYCWCTGTSIRSSSGG